MYSFKNTTPTNGFDFNNLNNSRQNNYAWSMEELDQYIYVGTGRNVPYNIFKNIAPEIITPMSITPPSANNSPEIWRYKKDDSLPWERVYSVPKYLQISGLRFIVSHKPFKGNKNLYAASYGGKLKIFKSSNGVNWFPLSDFMLKGTSSRAMISHKGKLYIATIDEKNFNSTSKLYSSEDPEFYPWKDEIDLNNPLYDKSKNPNGSITDMKVFNNKIYVATSNPDGIQVWRTNSSTPKLNDWTLIVDKGFGDSTNQSTLSMGTFKNHLYVSATKKLPLAWLAPIGFDIIRISPNDKWSLVVGSRPITPSTPSKGIRTNSLSGLESGFNNPFNVYAWQIKEYQDKLLISTFDDSSNMEVILEFLIANKVLIENKVGTVVTDKLIKIYQSIVSQLNSIRYPFGFDLYESSDGINFTPIFLNGLSNKYNYGGRNLFIDSSNTLYIGTANPFQGCEVWKVKSKSQDNYCYSKIKNYRCLLSIKKEINENFNLLDNYIPMLLSSISK